MIKSMKNKLIISLILFISLVSILTSAFASTDEAGLFCTSDLTNSYGSLTLGLANTGMQGLGFTITAYNTSVNSRTTVMNYINSSGNNYGFYLKCHANSSLLAIVSGNSSSYIYPSDISGNWHFVFLDGCSTAASSNFASAFHTVGYSSRGFLGWYTTVYTDKAYAFSQVFWNQVGTNTVRDAALTAAASVPGSGTTPIKYYGDTSYHGWAW